eukprot:CAMPEP_0115233392 /NCGR_PEP_ID=MMETSP0270-20121206/34252_1 /TAXON_ID=71861 /ORGANISM="Scrippsiella trochoidea, Strain CCMP3099" /LENGTH=67 /DNA_ID=CAMNT_0002648103 /DNA_START=745 /DNA_END=944 /DNA_ORIENTATION=+
MDVLQASNHLISKLQDRFQAQPLKSSKRSINEGPNKSTTIMLKSPSQPNQRTCGTPSTPSNFLYNRA